MNVTRLQYPTQTGPYAIKVKEGDKWHDYDTLRLEISVGQNYHEGDKFLCTINWARPRFDNIVILCNDTLQRYNLALQHGGEPDDYLSQTFFEGSKWIERNHSALKNTTIARWEDWRTSDHFLATVNEARNVYNNNSQFRFAVEDSISSVYTRRLGKGLLNEKDKDSFYKLSLDYLMEETAGLASAYSTHPGISAYPGTFLEMWRMFVGKPIDGPLKGLSNSHCIRIDFSRKTPAKSFSGQHPQTSSEKRASIL
jgi:tRNA-dependent cyclodipeptide synthase